MAQNLTADKTGNTKKEHGLLDCFRIVPTMTKKKQPTTPLNFKTKNPTSIQLRKKI